MSEKKIYVLLTDTGTMFTKMIKLYTRKPYNHASIAFDHNLQEVYSFGRKNARNPFSGGFVKEDITKGLFKQAQCTVYCFTVTNSEIEKMQLYIRKIAENKDCYRYNLLGLFAILMNKQLKRDNAFFCSQFVASVLKQCSHIHFDKPLSLITPHDIQKVADFQLVYQGELANFNQNLSHVQDKKALNWDLSHAAL